MTSMQKSFLQTTYVRDLPYTGMANGFPGRHVFRIDEKILPGVCIRCWLNIFNIQFDLQYVFTITKSLRDLIGANLPLVFAPENGNMLGGTMVNLTGPCFEPGMRVTCRFDDDVEDGEGDTSDGNDDGYEARWSTSPGLALSRA